MVMEPHEWYPGKLGKRIKGKEGAPFHALQAMVVFLHALNFMKTWSWSHMNGILENLANASKEKRGLSISCASSYGGVFNH